VTAVTVLTPDVLRFDEPARILDGRPIAAEIRESVRRQARSFRARYGFSPVLAAVVVGHELASSVYVQQILRSCAAVGVPSRVVDLPRTTTADALRRAIEGLNEDREVCGIIVQQPLPRHIPLGTVTDTILPAKDIDGIHPLNTGLMALGYEGFLPACAEAAVAIPRFYGYELEGKRAVVIGRSNIVGKPLALMLLQKNATVTICHSATQNLKAMTLQADVIVAAVGKRNVLTADMVKPGAVVIDVGMNRNDEGKLCGDVDFEGVRQVAGYITPVPGGVGPMTITMLLVNTLEAAERSQGS